MKTTSDVLLRRVLEELCKDSKSRLPLGLTFDIATHLSNLPDKPAFEIAKQRPKSRVNEGELSPVLKRKDT